MTKHGNLCSAALAVLHLKFQPRFSQKPQHDPDCFDVFIIRLRPDHNVENAYNDELEVLEQYRSHALEARSPVLHSKWHHNEAQRAKFAMKISFLLLPSVQLDAPVATKQVRTREQTESFHGFDQLFDTQNTQFFRLPPFV